MLAIYTPVMCLFVYLLYLAWKNPDDGDEVDA